jgi:hypothetical protein
VRRASAVAETDAISRNVWEETPMETPSASEAPDIFLSYSRDDQVTAWRAAEPSGRRDSIQARELIALPGSRHSSRAGRGQDRKDGRSVNRRPRLCQNSRDRFLPVNFSHVDAISGDISAQFAC